MIDDGAEGADDTLLRPFVITGGRTRPGLRGLQVETQIRSTAQPGARPLRFEAQRIVELCRQPHSLAEVAVALGQPLGVTRVLVADLVAANAVVCEQPSPISIALLERILDRVRAL
jgi:hypothetical protein